MHALYDPADPRIAALQKELRPGENVQWQSFQFPKLSGSSLGILFFAVPWTAFALFWTGMAWVMTRGIDGDADPIGMIFPLFGVPFILVGLGMLLTPFLRYKAAKRTIFAVTNERIIRLYQGKGTISQSVPGSRISKVKVKSKKADYATLDITMRGKAEDFEPKGNRFFMRDIERAEFAKDLIKELADRSRKKSED